MKYLILCSLLILNLLAKESDNKYNNKTYKHSLLLDKQSYINDNEYAKELSKFRYKYPDIASFITNRESFEFFKNRYRLDKKIINHAIKKTFSKKEKMETKNIVYIFLALEFSASQLDTKKLIRTIKKLKNRYSLDDMKYVLSFWMTYKNKYGLLSHKKKKVIYFKKAMKVFGVSTMKKYSQYSDDFYSTLLPEKFNNNAYLKTINALILSIKSSKMEMQSYFLKIFSLDIQIALENGNNPREIVNYFKEFAKRDFTLQFKTLDCHQKQGIALLVSDNLDYKLDWLKNNPEAFYTTIKMINEQKNNKQIINILGLYNYASVIYSKMKKSKQKNMFKNLINLPTDNILFNLSLIYALGNHTEYFAAIINDNNNMYKNNKYKEILYVSRNGKNMLNLFKEDNMELFAENIDDLVSTSYENIHNLSESEKIEIALEVADYASYASDTAMVISGVGILPLICKTLAKATIKGVIKQGVQVSTKKVFKFMNAQKNALSKCSIKYTKNKTLNSYVNCGVKITKPTSKIIEKSIKIYNSLYSIQKQKRLCTQKMK